MSRTKKTRSPSEVTSKPDTPAPAASAPARDPAAARAAVIRLLLFAVNVRRLHKLKELQKDFESVLKEAKERGRETDWPTRSQFDRAIGRTSGKALLKAICSRLQASP